MSFPDLFLQPLRTQIGKPFQHLVVKTKNAQLYFTFYLSFLPDNDKTIIKFQALGDTEELMNITPGIYHFYLYEILRVFEKLYQTYEDLIVV